MHVAARRLAAAAVGAATAGGGVSSSGRSSSLLRSSRGGAPLARLTLARHFAIINGASLRTGSRSSSDDRPAGVVFHTFRQES